MLLRLTRIPTTLMLCAFFATVALFGVALLGTAARGGPPEADLQQHLNTAQRVYAAGKWDQARELLLPLVDQFEGNQRAEVLHQIGYCLQRKHRHDEAIGVFRRILAMGEKADIETKLLASAKIRLGGSLRMEGQSEQAVAVLQSVPEIKGVDPTSAVHALLSAGYEFNARGSKEQAVATFRRITTMTDAHHDYLAAAYLSLARIIQEEGNHQEAIDTLKKIADLHPVSSTKRARAAVYILENQALLAGDVPFHIKPYVSKVTPAAVRLYWVSQGDIARGEVALPEGGDAKIASVEVKPLKETICKLHKVDITNLQPHTRYQYQVRCAGEELTGSFVTAPRKAEPFTFCVIGDTQSYNPSLQRLLDAMGREQADLILHVGDITDRGNLWGEWKAGFFDPGWSYLQHSPLFPAYGNHDGGPYFPSLFELEDRYYYSFDWGNAHFIILDSYGSGSGGAGRKKQYQWLKADLEANDKPWTFVGLHVPMVATRTSIAWFGREDLLPLLEQHEVDIVFSGHHPHYRRYLPIGSKGKRPILHITSGGGGGPVGGRTPSPLLARGVDSNHYCKITVDGDRLSLVARSISGEVIDQFELQQNGPDLRSGRERSAVDTPTAGRIISLYRELSSDRTNELLLFVREQPAQGEGVELILDLAKLPRGPLDWRKLPEDARLVIRSTAESAWQIKQQSVPLSDRYGKISAVAPEGLTVQDGRVAPDAAVQVVLESGDLELEPFETTARIKLQD